LAVVLSKFDDWRKKSTGRGGASADFTGLRCEIGFGSFDQLGAGVAGKIAAFIGEDVGGDDCLCVSADCCGVKAGFRLADSDFVVSTDGILEIHV